MVVADPEMLTKLNILESVGLYDHNAQLNEISVEKSKRALLNAQHNLHLSHHQRIPRCCFKSRRCAIIIRPHMATLNDPMAMACEFDGCWHQNTKQKVEQKFS